MSAPHLVKSADPKAFRTLGGPSIDDVTLDSVDVLPPGPGQVAVDIKAVSLNYRDLAVVTGRYPRSVSGPTIIASDGSGEVTAVGEGVTAFKRGDRVVGSFFQNWITGPFLREYGASALGGAIDGVLTEQRVFDQQGLVRLPEHMSYEEGATLPCAGLDGLERSGSHVAGSGRGHRATARHRRRIHLRPSVCEDARRARHHYFQQR